LAILRVVTTNASLHTCNCVEAAILLFEIKVSQLSSSQDLLIIITLGVNHIHSLAAAAVASRSGFMEVGLSRCRDPSFTVSFRSTVSSHRRALHLLESLHNKKRW
jgi:hypothetical protein